MCGCGGVNTPPYLFMKGEMNMNKSFMDYRNEYLNVLGRDAEVIFHEIDSALETCLNDYYDACETSDMLSDTMKLFGKVEHLLSLFFRSVSNKLVAEFTTELIVSEMREREWEVESKYTDDELWQQYVDTLEKNMDYELERKMYAVRKFQEDAKIYTSAFDSDWLESEQ